MENTKQKHKKDAKRTWKAKRPAQGNFPIRWLRLGLKKEPGIDGILVTVGLCIIALLLCVVMKDSLETFIQTIVGAMTTEAQRILGGVGM